MLDLADGPGGLRADDSFTPFDQSVLDVSDGELGPGEPILAEGGPAGSRRLVFASTAGVLDVIDLGFVDLRSFSTVDPFLAFPSTRTILASIMSSEGTSDRQPPILGGACRRPSVLIRS